MRRFWQRILAATVALLLAMGAIAGKAEAKAPYKPVTKAGWYALDVNWGYLGKKGAYLITGDARRLRAGAIKNGKLTSALPFYGPTVTTKGRRCFKLASKITYGKFTISGYSVRKLHPTKKVSAWTVYKSAKKKSVYWLCVRVKGGKVVEARWMPETSVYMLD